MSFNRFCPICNNEISQDRHLTSGSSICACGWCNTDVDIKASRELENKKIKIMIGFAICATLFYGHLLSWGSYAIAIPFVKVQQMTGTLSHDGYQDLAQHCVQLNKFECAETAYIDMYHQTGDVEGVQQLAHLQTLIGEKPRAVQTYANYFKFGGKNADAAVAYGALLEENGQFEAALTQYEDSIRLRPMTLPINATTSIVRIEIKLGRYQEAYQRINEFHESAENAKGYLNTELAQLEEKLHPTQALATKASGKVSPTGHKRRGVASI